MRRYPLEPLMRAAGISTMVQLRASFPMNGATYRQVLDEGLSEVQADRWAVRLGLLPCNVWPEWLEAAAVDCAAEDCAVRFVPSRPGHRFCSKRCRERVGQRQRYQSDEVTRARRLEQSARYYAEAGDYVRARMRRRHHDNRDAELQRMRARYRAQKEQAA